MKRFLSSLLLGLALESTAYANDEPVNSLTEYFAVIQIGGAHAMPEGIEFYRDGRVEARLEQLLAMLIANSENPRARFSIRLIDSQMLNAVSMPGGFLGVTRGLLAYVENDAQLAVLVGHELAHAQLRHGNTTRALGASLMREISGEAKRRGGASNEDAYSRIFASYSKQQEFEADQYGVLFALRAGYSLADAISIFERLAADEEHTSASKGAESQTHPTWHDRLLGVKAIEDEILSSASSFTLANQMLAMGSYERAQELLKEFLRFTPGSHAARVNLASAYFQQAAEIAVGDSIAKSPIFVSEPEAFGAVDSRDLELATVRMKQAIEVLGEISEDSPYFSVASAIHGQIANVMAYLAEDKEARASFIENARLAFTLAIEADGPHPVYLVNLAQTAILAGERDVALQLAEKAASDDASPQTMKAVQLIKLQAGPKSGKKLVRKAAKTKQLQSFELQGLWMAENTTQVTAKLGKPDRIVPMPGQADASLWLFEKAGVKIVVGGKAGAIGIFAEFRFLQNGPAGLKSAMTPVEVSKQLGEPQTVAADAYGTVSWYYENAGIVLTFSREGKLIGAGFEPTRGEGLVCKPEKKRDVSICTVASLK